MQNEPIWKQLVKKINEPKKIYSNDPYVHLYRQDLMREFPARHHNTIDMYVKMICAVGYLRKVNRGHYIILDEIPLDIPMSKFEKNYRGNMLWIEQVLLFSNLYKD